MNILIDILVCLISILHIYFLVLEMFLWTKPIGLKTFRQSLERAELTSKLAANQGLYNGFLAAGLIWGLFFSETNQSKNILLFFLTCISVAGIFGAMTVNRKIFFIQGLPAIFTIFIILFI